MAESPRDGSPESGADEQPATFHEAFARAARNAGIGQVAPGETPTGSSLLRAIGGVRGLIESILPGLGFLVLYTFTKNLPLAVIAPIAVSVVFVVVRLATRSAVMPAIAGLIGVGVSAGLALFTGRAEDNFLLGIVINVVCLVALLVSLVVRRPLIGVIVSLLANDPGGYRADRAKGRVVLVATWCWVGLFSIRLLAELPLYFAGETELLGSVKLILGVPFYAIVLWVTWLLVRAAYSKTATETPSTS
ncbi:DUF3159 domain-containing protein [Herbiconiux moechotypicola]|uniref:DUF3159 domain-containing protein n=1 Tax=Herbiconiux moechotypicola TaxID=637393 RepID=A0ABN3D738_9MICO|nr:DUF3159 domain-containing protein [Herbiconiux moechotypicola]MCS5728568.1 DUF3159 domain-containing protein [Herbiconiux moechotypicola]